jgi:hypothetical protein
MAGHENSQVRPTATQSLLRIAAGSPLAIQGIFLEILRERFKEGNGLEWPYNEDPTLTEILIEASFNEETESRNQTPALYVNRLQSRPLRIAVGDRAGLRLKDHLEGFTALMTVALSIECVSNDEGESSVLGDTVQFTLLAAQDVIQREFGLHSFEHPILGQTTPYDRDTSKWMSPVEFNIEFWVRWIQVPISPLLQQLGQQIQASGQSLFRQSVLNSMRRAVPDEDPI